MVFLDHRHSRVAGRDSMRSKAKRYKPTQTNKRGMVFIDPTVTPVVIGYGTRSRLVLTSASTSNSIVSALARVFPEGFPRKEEIVVVDGPGRFSSLRHASVIVNNLASVRSAHLFRVRGPLHYPLTSEKLSRIVDKRHRVSVLKPYYERAPSITVPRKMRKTP